MATTDYNNTAAVVVEGGVSATAIAFFSNSVKEMIPWLIVAIPLVILDLQWGVKAARARGETIRFSKAFRKTFGKVAEYICWSVLAATMSLAFGYKWIEWLVLGVVYINELSSIVGNYLETRGLHLSMLDLYRLVFRKAGEKVGIDIEKEEVEQIIKPKRDARGRFVKKNNQ